jgi:hypothetical protein
VSLNKGPWDLGGILLRTLNKSMLMQIDFGNEKNRVRIPYDALDEIEASLCGLARQLPTLQREIAKIR